MDLDRMPAEVRIEAERFKRGMNPTHRLMAEWILQNPGGTLREMGNFFGYSVSWLSQVINSDMFKAHLAERMKDIQAVVTQSVPQKMEGLALLACERMQEVLEKTQDAELIEDTFDKVMHRYGYAPNAKTGMPVQGPAINQQNNVFFLNAEQFAKVQGRLIDAHAAPSTPLPSPQPEKEDDRPKLPHVEAVPTRN